PYTKSALAEGMAGFGDVDGALHLIDEIVAQVERPGWEEREHYAEILRIKGWLLSEPAVDGREQVVGTRLAANVQRDCCRSALALRTVFTRDRLRPQCR